MRRGTPYPLTCDEELLSCLGPAFPPLSATDPVRVRRIAGDGTWTAPVAGLQPGSYRAYASFIAQNGSGKQVRA